MSKIIFDILLVWAVRSGRPLGSPDAPIPFIAAETANMALSDTSSSTIFEFMVRNRLDAAPAVQYQPPASAQLYASSLRA